LGFYSPTLHSCSEGKKKQAESGGPVDKRNLKSGGGKVVLMIFRQQKKAWKNKRKWEGRGDVTIKWGAQGKTHSGRPLKVG